MTDPKAIADAIDPRVPELYPPRNFTGDLIAAADLLRAYPTWLAFPENMPQRHQDVWCLNRDGWQFRGRICYGMHKPFFTYPRGDGSPSNTAPAWIDVTHFMPLPSPPEEPKP